MDKTIGVLGGGQLGRMMLEAANRLNICGHVLADADSAPAKQVSAHSSHVTGSVTNPVAVKHLAAAVDVLTVEIEHVDTEVLEEIAHAAGGADDDSSGHGHGRSSRNALRESRGGNGKGAAMMSGGLGPTPAAGSGQGNGNGNGNGHGSSSKRNNNGLSKTLTNTTITSAGTSSSSSAAAATATGGGTTSSRRCAVHPHWRTLRTIQDKFTQKAHLQAHGLPCAKAVAVDQSGSRSPETTVERAVMHDLGGFPAVLKARTGAYDGRGNFVLHGREDVPRGLEALRGRPLYVEEWAGFVKELAVMVVKVDSRVTAVGEEGEGGGNGAGWQSWTLAYPVVETVHEDNVCSLVYAPARDVDDKTRKRAQDVARRAVATFWGKGIFGVEMFLMPNGEILINEIAPRPHNSGHFTIEACPVSQFEAHLRAILDLPLAAEDLRADRRAIMLNILGGADKNTHMLLPQRALSVPRASVHLYGKGEGKPGRKMGHITVTHATMQDAEMRMEPLIALAGAMRAERLKSRSESSASGSGHSGGNGGRDRERDRRRSNELQPTSPLQGTSKLLQTFTRSSIGASAGPTTTKTSRYPPQLDPPLSPAESPLAAPAAPRAAAFPLPSRSPPAPAAPVAVAMGSDSDLKTMQPALELLRHFRVPFTTSIKSAHRTPRAMIEFAEQAASRGVRVIIAGAGGAAHLPGMIAACTRLPVIGVPVKGSTLDGLDSLLSIVQMPRGCPVATVAINNSNNAAQLAVRMLALSDDALRDRLERFLAEQTQSVKEKADRLETLGPDRY